MASDSAAGALREPASRRGRALVLIAGLLLPQLVLRGPDLAGLTVPYPCDLLALPQMYLPAEQFADVRPQDPLLLDLVQMMPQYRDFSAREFRAGRLPLWNPYLFAGVPEVNFPKYSPFELLYVVFPSPWTVAVLQITQALVAGSGAYLAFRRICESSFWAATICAWAWPLTGFLVLWTGYVLTGGIVWLPWVLLATDSAVRRPWGWGGPALAVSTMFCALSRMDVAGHVLIASGVYAVYLVGRQVRIESGRGVLRLAAPAVGWSLGLALCLPYGLPLVEYTRTGARIQERASGVEERPPVGWSALPEVFAPEFYGSSKGGAIRLVKMNQLESSAAAYAGAVLSLFLAPLALADPKRRSMALFWVGMALLGLVWQLNMPGFVQMLRLPVLNMLSHNRFVFVTGFAFVALAAMGWDTVRSGALAGRAWLPVQAAVPALLGLWCLGRIVFLPEPLFGGLDHISREQLAGLRQAFSVQSFWNAVPCLLAAAATLGVWAGRGRTPAFLPIIAIAIICELFPFAWKDRRSADARLYYPPIPALQALKDLPPGRLVGAGCLPPNLAMTFELPDIRGYDAVDPLAVVNVLELAREPGHESPPYARTQWLVPRIDVDLKSYTIRLSPVMSMLNVRYIVARARPPIFELKAVAESPGYWVFENAGALPRAWVPRRVETLPSTEAILERLGDAAYDPLDPAYVEQPIELPEDTEGDVAIVEDLPCSVRLDARLNQKGLVVLSDLYDPGWQARLDGKPVEILRVNSVVRGVVTPAGRHTLEFTYRPASFLRGLQVAGIALGLLAIWSGVVFWRSPRPQTVT